MKPVFIFSLPRSGSTLLQRMMTSMPQIASTSEPWLLLPLIYSLRKEGVYANYWHNRSVEAITDFYGNLPNGKNTYFQEIREFAERLYLGAAGNDVVYFLDKTPRYHLIIDEIVEIFPDAKFIFLWRNPLAVASSINSTWGNGKWKLYSYKVDLYDGVHNLVSAYEKHKDKSYSVRYEELVASPESEWRRILDYLELPYDDSAIKSFIDVSFDGKMGDPTGVYEYNSVSMDSVNKWQHAFSNPLRKRWGRAYLKWIGEKRLEVMGYKFDELLKQLHDIPTSTRFVFSDVIRRVYGVIYCLFEPMFLKDKLSSAKNWRKVISHR